MSELRPRLARLEQFAKDIFEFVCLLKDHKFRDSKEMALIQHRIDQMRKSYPWLEEEKPLGVRRFKDKLNEDLEDPEFRKAYEEEDTWTM